MIPTTPSEWESLLAVATDEERAEIEAILEADLQSSIWRPQVGRQMEAVDSRASIIGYGGSAGGGKTDLIAGLAVMEHKRSLIIRREKTQTEGIVQRLTEILGTSDGYNSQKSQWRIDGKLIEFGGLDNPTDHQKWQGRPHDLKAFDEVTEQRENQVRFVQGWARSNDAQQVCRILHTFNPPTTVEGRWVVKFYAPWIDASHHNPAKPGELRHYTTLHGGDYECLNGERFVIYKGEAVYDFDPSEFPLEKIITPKSRTFIPSRVTDNYFYVRSGYIETLQSLPDVLRRQMLEGDFNAGVEDDAWQVIPTIWVEAAMERWKPRIAKGVMDSIGADISAGGDDDMIIARRHDVWFDEAIVIPGRELPQETAGPLASGHIIMARHDRAVVHADVIGWGLSCVNFLTSQQVQVVPVNFASASLERSTDGVYKFCNLRAETIWRMRESLDPANPNPVSLPNDPKLKADLCSYKWELRPCGVSIKPKVEQKLLLGRSPDRGDAYCMANMTTIKNEVYSNMVDKSYDRYADIY